MYFHSRSRLSYPRARLYRRIDLVYGGVAMIWLNDMTPTNNIGGSSDQIATYGYAMHIDYGKTVRCVKE